MTPDPATRAREIVKAWKEYDYEGGLKVYDREFAALEDRIAAALTEPPGRGPETGPDVERRLAEIRAREAQATKGPWRVVYNGRTLLSIAADYPKVPARLIAPVREASEEERESRDFGAFQYGGEDALNYEFLAHAREDIEWLLARLAACDPREARLREALEKSRDLIVDASYVTQYIDDDSAVEGWRRKAKDWLNSVRDLLASPPPDETGVADAGASGRGTARGAEEGANA